MRANGGTHAQIAAHFGVHRSTVGRILAAGLPPVPEHEKGDREREIDHLEACRPDAADVDRARLGTARSVSRKMDQLGTVRTAASGMAMASLSGRREEILVALSGAGNDDLQWLADLFGRPADAAMETERYRGALTAIASTRSDGSSDYAAPRYTAEEAQRVAREALDVPAPTRQAGRSRDG